MYFTSKLNWKKKIFSYILLFNAMCFMKSKLTKWISSPRKVSNSVNYSKIEPYTFTSDMQLK